MPHLLAHRANLAYTLTMGQNSNDADVEVGRDTLAIDLLICKEIKRLASEVRFGSITVLIRRGEAVRASIQSDYELKDAMVLG